MILDVTPKEKITLIPAATPPLLVLLELLKKQVGVGHTGQVITESSVCFRIVLGALVRCHM